MSTSTNDELYKVVIIGDPNVGKSSILKRIIVNYFDWDLLGKAVHLCPQLHLWLWICKHLLLLMIVELQKDESQRSINNSAACKSLFNLSEHANLSVVRHSRTGAIQQSRDPVFQVSYWLIVILFWESYWCFCVGLRLLQPLVLWKSGILVLQDPWQLSHRDSPYTPDRKQIWLALERRDSWTNRKIRSRSSWIGVDLLNGCECSNGV